MSAPEDVKRANYFLGAAFVIEAIQSPNGRYAQELSNNGMTALDAFPQRSMYQTFCPTGPSSCHQPTQGEIGQLQSRIGDHAEKMSGSEILSAFYLVDDYWADMSPTLPRLAEEIRRKAPGVPIACGVSSEVPVAQPGGSAFSVNYQAIENAVTNVSDDWCDIILVYSYSPPSSTPAADADWRMRASLPITLRLLSEQGLKPERQLFIGVPQAFNYTPRTGIRGNPIKPEWRSHASGSSLRDQIGEFCRSGFASIGGYVWKDGSAGNVATLATDPMLREGFLAGAAECQEAWQ